MVTHWSEFKPTFGLFKFISYRYCDLILVVVVCSYCKLLYLISSKFSILCFIFPYDITVNINLEVEHNYTWLY